MVNKGFTRVCTCPTAPTQAWSMIVSKRRVLPAVFAAALLFTLIMALLPKPPQLPGQPTDKVQHILAFIVLTVLALKSFPRARLLVVGVGLSAFGVLIEVLQAIPGLNRSSDVADWVADTGAVIVVLLLGRMVQARRKRRVAR